MVGNKSRRMSFGRAFGRFKTAVKVKNHWEGTLAVGSSTTAPFTLALAVDDVTNRSTHIQNGSILRSIVVEVEPQTIVAGKYQCLMWKHKGPVTMADPIAAYWSSTDPLSEDAILLRSSLMGRVETRRVLASALVPVRFRCAWKGKTLMRDGDAVELDILSTGTSATCDIRVWTTYVM